MIRVSVVIPSVRGADNAYFQRAFKSVEPQLHDGDEIIVEFDPERHNDKGAIARNKAIRRARGTHIMFLDDDDRYLPGAIDAVRGAVAAAPDAPHLFRVRYPDHNGMLLWKEPRFAYGEVSTLGIVVPNRACLPDWLGLEDNQAKWTNHEAAFLAEASRRLGQEIVFRSEVIAEALGAK